MIIYVKNKDTLQIDDFKFKCCIGKKGSTINKVEGDKKTPKGTFEIENLYFRKDRRKCPETLLQCTEIKENMGWCNDVTFPGIYNKIFKIEKSIRYEKLKRKDFKYFVIFFRKSYIIAPAHIFFDFNTFKQSFWAFFTIPPEIKIFNSKSTFWSFFITLYLINCRAFFSYATLKFKVIYLKCMFIFYKNYHIIF